MSDKVSEPIGHAIVEVMGHRRLAGFVTEVKVAGADFLRIDIPGPDGGAAATQLYNPTSIFCLTPTTEEIARAVARRAQPEPVHRYELPAPGSVHGEPAHAGLDDDEDDDDLF